MGGSAEGAEEMLIAGREMDTVHCYGKAWIPLQGRSLNQVIFLQKTHLDKLGSFQSEDIKAALGEELFH